MKIPLTPLRFLRHAERQFANRTAVVCGSDRFTYRQLAERAGELAGALRTAGIKPGDRVAFLGVNTHRLLEAYYGVLEAGAILLPLNIRLSAAELSHILNDAGASILFIEAQFVPLVDSFRAQLETVKQFVQLSGSPAAAWLDPHNYDQMLAAAEPYRLDISTVDEDATAEIFYTSGTSARPKGVMLTHRNIYLHAMSSAVMGSVEHGSVEMHSIPLFHANGWGTAHFLTMVGGKHVMLHAFDPVEVFRLIEAERVGLIRAVPIMATVLVNHPARKEYDLSSLTKVVIGGAACSPTLIREVEQAFHCVCYTGYGLTETSPTLTCAITKPEHGLFKEAHAPGDEHHYEVQAMTGWPLPGVELRIADAEGNILPEDGVASGELLARGDGVMAGYWAQPEASAEALRGGWFHTGDIATIAPDGFVMLVDRKKDIIISGGENVSSLEVEAALLAHAGVLEAAVIPVAHERWGEVPRALIVRKPGATVDEAELIAFSRGRLSHYKCPASVVFVETLPKTGTGKVLKRDLRNTYGQPAAAAEPAKVLA